jgi:hypothetical protein
MKDDILNLDFKLSLRRSTLKRLHKLAVERGFKNLNEYIHWLLLSDLNGIIVTEMDLEFEDELFSEINKQFIEEFQDNNLFNKPKVTNSREKENLGETERNPKKDKENKKNKKKSTKLIKFK